MHFTIAIIALIGIALLTLSHTPHEQPIDEAQIPATYNNAIEEAEDQSQPKPEPTPTVARKYSSERTDPFGRENPYGSFTPQIDYDYAEGSILIEDYMKATEHGEPISLSPYCTKQLLQWYGQKQISIRQSEQDIAADFRKWPTQYTFLNPYSDLPNMRCTPDFRWPGLIAYRFELTYKWLVSDGDHIESGISGLVAIVVRAHKPDGSLGHMRIMSLRHSNGIQRQRLPPPPTPEEEETPPTTEDLQFLACQRALDPHSTFVLPEISMGIPPTDQEVFEAHLVKSLVTYVSGVRAWCYVNNRHEYEQTPIGMWMEDSQGHMRLKYQELVNPDVYNDIAQPILQSTPELHWPAIPIVWHAAYGTDSPWLEPVDQH